MNSRALNEPVAWKYPIVMKYAGRASKGVFRT